MNEIKKTQVICNFFQYGKNSYFLCLVGFELLHQNSPPSLLPFLKYAFKHF